MEEYEQDFKQHFTAYMMIIRLTHDVKGYVESGIKDFEYALKLLEELKEKESNYFETYAQEHLHKALNERREQ